MPKTTLRDSHTQSKPKGTVKLMALKATRGIQMATRPGCANSWSRIRPTTTFTCLTLPYASHYHSLC